MIVVIPVCKTVLSIRLIEFKCWLAWRQLSVNLVLWFAVAVVVMGLFIAPHRAQVCVRSECPPPFHMHQLVQEPH